MATVNVEQRKTKQGIKYRARVRVRSDLLEKGYYEESYTFLSRAKAKKWGKERAEEIETLGIPKNNQSDKSLKEKSLRELILLYLEEYKNELGRSKFYALKAVSKRDIAVNKVHLLTSDDIIEGYVFINCC